MRCCERFRVEECDEHSLHAGQVHTDVAYGGNRDEMEEVLGGLLGSGQLSYLPPSVMCADSANAAPSQHASGFSPRSGSDSAPPPLATPALVLTRRPCSGSARCPSTSPPASRSSPRT
eukprot:3461969-Rhodomonas_salina.4